MEDLIIKAKEYWLAITGILGISGLAGYIMWVLKTRKQWHEGTKAKYKAKKAKSDFKLPSKADSFYPNVCYWVKVLCTCTKQHLDQVYIRLEDLKAYFSKTDVGILNLCYQLLKDDGILQEDDNGWYASRFKNYDESIDCNKYNL